MPETQPRSYRATQPLLPVALSSERCRRLLAELHARTSPSNAASQGRRSWLCGSVVGEEYRRARDVSNVESRMSSDVGASSSGPSASDLIARLARFDEAERCRAEHEALMWKMRDPDREHAERHGPRRLNVPQTRRLRRGRGRPRGRRVKTRRAGATRAGPSDEPEGGGDEPLPPRPRQFSNSRTAWTVPQ